MSSQLLNYMKINRFFFAAGLDVYARKRLYVLTMKNSTTHPEATMKKIIGSTTTCTSDEHRYLTGYTVRILAVIKNAARPDYDPDADDTYITDDEDLKRAGGITADDRVDVQPWIAKEGRFSFASSDPKAIDLACFAHLADKE